MDMNSTHRRSETLRRHAVTVTGEGEHAVLFCHGYGCDQGVWAPLEPPLSKLIATVMLDLTGAGRSRFDHLDIRGRHATLEGYATDLIEVCDAMPFKSLTFVGHSVGATIGLLAARQRPSLFKELILVAPSPSYINDGAYHGGFEAEQIDGLLSAMDDNFTSWAGMVTPLIMGAHDPKHADALERSFCSWNEAAAKHFARLTFLSDHRELLGSIEDDCLILQCKDDAIAPAAVGRYMAETLRRGSLIELNNVGHCPHISAPEETLSVLLEYLRYRARL